MSDWHGNADDVDMANASQASIGVVIPVHRDIGEVINATLDAVMDQTLQPSAIVVVVDAGRRRARQQGA